MSDAEAAVPWLSAAPPDFFYTYLRNHHI